MANEGTVQCPDKVVHMGSALSRAARGRAAVRYLRPSERTHLAGGERVNLPRWIVSRASKTNNTANYVASDGEFPFPSVPSPKNSHLLHGNTLCIALAQRLAKLRLRNESATLATRGSP